MKIATAVEQSGNSKIGVISATYASQASCPKDCAFLGSGCYAETGFVGITTRRLNKTATSIMDVANAESEAIDGLTGMLPLRLHVVGDSSTNAAARIVSKAASRHTAKHGQPVYTYTHAWREVSRKSWSQVSVLASCETLEHVKQAQVNGYATALVVSHHTSDKTVNGLIPCPSQTKGVKCADCKLCMRDQFLITTKQSIVFAAHGSAATKIQSKLIQIGA